MTSSRWRPPRRRQAPSTRVKGDRIDLAIMDVGLPDMDGREAVKVMRQNGFRSPIIMLTGQGSDTDTVMGLEAGANDYVVKPFKFAVLLARIRAQLRQYEASEDAVFQIGPYIFRPGSKLLTTEKGSKLKLTEKETAILRYLYRAGPGRGRPRHPAHRGLGLQFQRHHPHARDAYLPPAPEDRIRSVQRQHPRDRARRLQADPLKTIMALDDDIAVLIKAPLFNLLEKDALRLVAFASENRTFRAGDVLFRKGDRSDGGYVVSQGGHRPRRPRGRLARDVPGRSRGADRAGGPVRPHRAPRHGHRPRAFDDHPRQPKPHAPGAGGISGRRRRHSRCHGRRS